MFNNLDTTHSYDPIEILKVIYRLIMGGANGATDWASNLHNAFVLFLNNLPFYLVNFFARYAVFSILFSFVMFFVVWVYISKYVKMREEMLAKVTPIKDEVEMLQESMENKKWVLVQEHINSDDPNKWKLAILEADIILSELLDTLNLPGTSIGEKLKAIEPSDFTNIENAWEGHKIRNEIAHQGSDFLINQREAKRIIGLYQTVFEEFKII
jgi:hypothetical protein